MQKVLSAREKGILYFTISIVAFSIVFNFLIAPLLKKNDTLNREIELTRMKLKKYLGLLGQKENIQNKYSKLAQELDFSYLNENNIVTTLSKLEDLAKNANIRIIDIRPQGAAGGSLPYKALTIDLRTEGEMEGYLKFIYNLENSLLLLKIKRFQLSSKSNAQSLEGSFTISQISASQ